MLDAGHDLAFGRLNLSFADSVIAFYDGKYIFNFWRPVTAIRAAATDGNPETEADPNSDLARVCLRRDPGELGWAGLRI